ncbi:hypothetical protein ACFE04_030415 [Oxalis oulophora]
MDNLMKRKTGYDSVSHDDTTTESVTESSDDLLGWPMRKASISKSSDFDHNGDDVELKKSVNSNISELDMMKERFAKLLLGEDMSGSGKGVCTALAISNAITNLCATIFGNLWRLEPLPAEKKSMWKREMECLLCVSDHIVEFIPSWQTFPDGSKLEVMSCRPRSDLFINLPALRKLDNMLIEVLDSFTNTEFWYIDQGIIAQDSDGSASFRKSIQRQEEKWWLPVPRVPAGGLTEHSRKQLNCTRECTNQILKAAMAINDGALSEMEVPDSYLEALPKNGRACLGDVIYRYITSEQFSAECLLDCLDLSSEHVAVEIANRVEAATYVWRRRAHSKPPLHPNRSTTKSSWEMVKDLMVDGDKREILAERAESLLICLKQRFPGLTQTSLDTSKIHCNKSLAYSIVARIDDLLYVDDFTNHADKLSTVSSVSVISHKKAIIPYSVSVSSTPFKRSFATTPSFSPAPNLVSPARGERTPFLNNNSGKQLNRRGSGVKKVLTNYLSMEPKAKVCANGSEGSSSLQNSGGKENVAQRKDLSMSRSPNQKGGSIVKSNVPRYTVT